MTQGRTGTFATPGTEFVHAWGAPAGKRFPLPRQLGSYTFLELWQRNRGTTRQSLSGPFQCRHVDAIPDKPEPFAAVLLYEIDGKPRYVPAGQVPDLFHMPKRLEKVLVNDYRHLLAPSTKRRHLDFATGALVSSAHCSDNPAAVFVPGKAEIPPRSP